jgi:hypothetical protein
LQAAANIPLLADEGEPELLSNVTESNWKEDVEAILASLALATQG